MMFEAWTLRTEQVRAGEEKLRKQIRALDEQARAEFYRDYKKALKDPDTYAVLNYLFLAGLHHFYLGKYARGMANLLVMAMGIIGFFVTPLIGVALILLIILVELPALFRSQIIVADHNNRAGFRLLEQRRIQRR